MHFWKKQLRRTALAALLAFSSTTAALAAPNVTLNVHDGEVRDVLTAISALSDASIVTDESVKGKITIALDNVPFDTAIKLITSAKGLAYRMVDGVILVSTQENLNKFNGNVNVFKLNYARAEDVKTALNDILESDKKNQYRPYHQLHPVYRQQHRRRPCSFGYQGDGRRYQADHPGSQDHCYQQRGQQEPGH